MSDWKEYTLGNISSMRYGKMPNKELITDSGCPIFTGYQIVGFYPEYNCEEKQIVIVARGVGGTGDIKLSPPKCYVTNLSIIVELDTDIVDKKYFYYKYQKRNLKYLDSGSAQSQITIDSLRSLSVYLPELSKQKKIVGILSALDYKIDLLRRQNETLEAIAQTLFKRWFVEFEFPDENGPHYKSSGGKMVSSELGEIPDGWRIGRIRDIYDTSSGGTPSRKVKEYYRNGKILWVKSKELYNNIILNTEEKITDLGLNNSSAKFLPKNTILIAMYGATVGQISILGVPATCNQAICAILENKDYSYTFIYLLLKMNLKDWTSLAIGSAQQNLSQIVISNYKIIIPDEKTLEKFSDIVKPIFGKMKNNSLQMNLLIKTRNSLLPKLMSGQIRVK